MPYCHKCGMKVPEEALFCPNCGQKIVEIRKDSIPKKSDNQKPSILAKLTSIGTREVMAISAIIVVFIAFLPINQLIEVEVIQVFDGDTFETIQLGSIRLADASSPEINDTGGIEAKIFLESLLEEKRVYVNIDDLYRWDTTGRRIVCVIYVNEGSGLVNVNKALVDSSYAVIDDHLNEFHPSSWIHYWPISFLPETYFIEVIFFVSLIGMLYFLSGLIIAKIPHFL